MFDRLYIVHLRLINKLIDIWDTCTRLLSGSISQLLDEVAFVWSIIWDHIVLFWQKKLQLTRGVAGGVGVARSLLGLVAPLYRCLLTYKSYLRLLRLNTHTTATKNTTNMRIETLAIAPKLKPISLVLAPESPSMRVSDSGGVLGGGVGSVGPDDGDDGFVFVEEEELD